MSEVIHGDSLEELGKFRDNSFDSIVTDPPYELGFMGKGWDSSGVAYNVDLWKQALRVLKPGGYLAAFGGTRTYHRMAVAIEDAGFEIRDSLHWIYGSGFPKSLDVSKAIDKQAGVRRQSDYVPNLGNAVYGHAMGGGHTTASDPPVTDEAQQWEGWGTALKPAHEPIVLARKPLSEKTVAANVLEFGTGGINIDACRVATTDHWEAPGRQSGTGVSYAGSADGSLNISVSTAHEAGRWPSNVLFTHTPYCYADADGLETVEEWSCALDCPVAELDRQSGISASQSSVGRQAPKRNKMTLGDFAGTNNHAGHDDTGGASLFFPIFRYQAKAPKKERPVVEGVAAHPTVKPVSIMRWLVTLVTPPCGTVLDLFGGSGTTAEACVLEGFDYILIEREEDYVKLINKRLHNLEVETSIQILEETK